MPDRDRYKEGGRHRDREGLEDKDRYRVRAETDRKGPERRDTER
mgnify:CR=1 FL=1